MKKYLENQGENDFPEEISVNGKTVCLTEETENEDEGDENAAHD